MILEVEPAVSGGTISIVLVLQVVASLATIGGMCFAIFKLGRNTQKVESGIEKAAEAVKAQKEEMSDLKAEVRELGKVLTTMAVTTTRLDALSESLTRAHNYIDEMRHGEGFVYPLSAHVPTRTKGE